MTVTYTSGPTVVTFSSTDFTTNFPEFASCDVPAMQGWFLRASLVFKNLGSNPWATDAGMMAMMLYLLTAHIGWLNAPRDASGNPTGSALAVQQASPIVGRINSASQGSVSVGAEMGSGDASPSQAWYMQSRFGAEFWNAIAGNRTAIYVPPAGRGPIPPGVTLWPGWGRFPTY